LLVGILMADNSINALLKPESNRKRFVNLTDPPHERAAVAFLSESLGFLLVELSRRLKKRNFKQFLIQLEHTVHTHTSFNY